MRRWSQWQWPPSRWVDWANLILGAWLFISPWVLHTMGNRSASAGNFWWVGGAIFVVALWALSAPWARWTEWINGALAVWLFISPWVLGFADVRRASWDAWIIGVVVFFLALSALSVAPRLPAGGPPESRRPMWFGRRRVLHR